MRCGSCGAEFSTGHSCPNWRIVSSAGAKIPPPVLTEAGIMESLAHTAERRGYLRALDELAREMGKHFDHPYPYDCWSVMERWLEAKRMEVGDADSA